MTTLWICGKNLPDEPGGDTFEHAGWEFMGVFSTEELAVAACGGDPLFFVAPAKLDERAPDDDTPWPGGYIPATKEADCRGEMTRGEMVEATFARFSGWAKAARVK